MSVFLSADEVRELTLRDRPRAQARVLKALGVPFKPHPIDGILLVARSAVESAFGAQPAANDPPPAAPIAHAINVHELRAYGKKAHARRS